ncbi:Uncharacterized protein Adt_34749 [Abeliophyllum distichum]|uniref:CCHC-type domain-containing protein n=1 Tax=Abeliophyllum distichum TaxID=126358 RepID=A0ABD1R043_9LAMI
MVDKEKQVVLEDSCSEDEELKGKNKNGIGIESAEQVLEDTYDALEETREKKKLKSTMPSSFEVADNVKNDDITNPSQSAEMAKDVEGTHVLQLEKVPEANDNFKVPIEVVPKEAKGTEEDRFSDCDNNIDDKEEDKQEEASIGVKTRLMMEGEPDFRNENMVLQKLLRAPRYFESADCSWEACYKCGEDNHKGRCKVKKTRKPCFICADLGHEGKHCKRVNNCFICSKKGHLATKCPLNLPEKDHTSRFCLKCGNSGHDMFSCTDEYCSEDLKCIQCYVCKAFGHLCCVDNKSEGPRQVSCYSCGQSGHSGFECTKLNENAKEMQSTSVRSKCEEGGHSPQKCIKSPEAGGLGNTEDKDVVANPVNTKSAKTLRKKKQQQPETTVNVSRRWPTGNKGWYGTQAKGQYFAKPGPNVWLSPEAAARYTSNAYSNNYFSQHPRQFVSHYVGTQPPQKTFDYQTEIRLPQQIYNHQIANSIPQRTLNHQTGAQLPHPVLDHKT